MPAIIGMVSRPGLGGGVAAGYWKYWPRNIVEPNIAMPTATEARMASAVVRSEMIFSGMIGYCLIPPRTSAASSTTPPPTMARSARRTSRSSRLAGEGDPDQEDADAGGQQDGAEPVDLGGALVCWMFRVACSRISAMTASGTQTKKHQRQPSGLSTMTPPRSGPPAVTRP